MDSDIERTNEIEERNSRSGSISVRAAGPSKVDTSGAASSPWFSRGSAARAGRASALAVNKVVALYDQARRRALQSWITSLQRITIVRIDWRKRFVRFKADLPLESLTMIAGVSFITGFLIRLWRLRRS